MSMLPKLLDSSGNEARRLRTIRQSISEKCVPLSTATLALARDESIPDRSYVELFTVNGSAGIFRSRTPTNGYGVNRANSYTLEHAICEVGDWLVRADIEQTQTTLAAALTQIFAYYGGSRWQLGTVSASGNVILSANYSNLLQTMNSMIAQVHGAFMSFDFTTTPWTINVGTMDSTVNAEGRLGRNLQSVQIRKDDSQLCTRVWLEGLTGGKMDADTIGTYGVIERKLPDRDYTAAQAATVATAYLTRHKRPVYSIQISGKDFSAATGETLDRVAIGKMYRLAIPEDSIVAEYNVVEIQWPDCIRAPETVQITLSEPDSTLVDFIARQSSDSSGAGGAAEYQDRKNKEAEEGIGEAAAKSRKNAEDIAKNTEDIEKNTEDIAKNTEDITKNAQDIAINADNIEVNAENIQINTETLGVHAEGISLVTEKANKNGNILAAAGISIDPVTGVAIYATNHQTNLGAMLNVQSDKIGMVVGTGAGGNYIKAGEICLAINATTGQSTAYLLADHVIMDSVSGTTIDVAINGKLSVTDLKAQIAQLDSVDIDDLAVGTLDVGRADFTTITVDNLYITNSTLEVGGYTATWKTITIGGTTYHLLGY